jgi:hypothetical protein
MRTFTTSAPPDAQLFLGVDPIQLLVVHNHAFAFQQHADPAPFGTSLRDALPGSGLAKPTPPTGNRLHLFANFRIVRRSIAPNGLGIDTPSRDIAAQYPAVQRMPPYLALNL